MAKQEKQELAVIDFEKFSIAQLPELQGKKEEIASVIKANPIVEIVDNSTYELAKKSRTAVKTLRTGLEKEQKDVKKKIKEFVLDVVDGEYSNLVTDVKSAEKQRQDPIDVWEEKKEQERLEKARLEQERIDGIKNLISEFKENNSKFIENCVFESIEATRKVFEKEVAEFDRTSLQEYEVLFDDAVSYLTNLLNSRISTLTEQEQIRIDNLLIQEKNAENSRIQEWQRTWNANIDTLSFDDLKDVKSVLVKSKLADLKHYSNEYKEIYTSTEKRLHSQIEFVSKAEEQRIAKEKFLAEKKEFEEKQLEAKFQERKKFLVDEDYWRIYLLAECGNFESNARLKLLAYTDETFEDFKLAVLKAKEPVVSETKEIDEVAQTESLGKVWNKNVTEKNYIGDHHESDVDEKGVVKTHDFANYKEEVQHIEKVTKNKVQGESVFDVEKIESQIWDNIHKEWHTDFHGMTFLEYLKEFYNSPKKKE
jgi:hypothetical protein